MLENMTFAEEAKRDSKQLSRERIAHCPPVFSRRGVLLLENCPEVRQEFVGRDQCVVGALPNDLAGLIDQEIRPFRHPVYRSCRSAQGVVLGYDRRIGI